MKTTFKTVCAWCGVEKSTREIDWDIYKQKEVISHGMCKSCAEKFNSRKDQNGK